MISWETELLASLESKNEARAISLIHQGFPVDIQIRQKDTEGRKLAGFTYPLIRAVRLGLLEVTRCLISYGCNLSIVDSLGNTPILTAAGEGNMEILKTLVNARSDISSRDLYGNTLLHVATRNRRIEVIKYCLQTLEMSPLVKNRSGQTPMAIAKSMQEHCEQLGELESLQKVIEVLWKAQNDTGNNTLTHRFRNTARNVFQRVPLVPSDNRFEKLVSPLKPRRNIECYLYEKHKVIFKSLNYNHGYAPTLTLRRTGRLSQSKRLSPYSNPSVLRASEL